MVALPDTSLQEAEKLAEQLRVALLNTPLDIQGVSVPLTSSFGVAQYNGGSDSLESLLHDADTALYESKRNGRNAVRVHAVSTA